MTKPKKPRKKTKKAGNLRGRFVDEFMIDRNATEAAIRAGYSARSASCIGSRLLKDVKILSEINKRGAEQSQRLGITADRVMQEYERLALLDPLDLFNPDGSMRALVDMPEDARRAIAGLEVKELRDALVLDSMGNPRALQATLKKIKLVDKKGALDSISKIMGLMREKVEITGADGRPLEVISEVRERLNAKLLG